MQARSSPQDLSDLTGGAKGNSVLYITPAFGSFRTAGGQMRRSINSLSLPPTAFARRLKQHRYLTKLKSQREIIATDPKLLKESCGMRRQVITKRARGRTSFARPQTV